MRITPRICLLFFGVIVISCSKDNIAGLTYPSIYHKSGFRPNGNLRVFASTGEVNNKDIVSKFNQYDSFIFNNAAFNAGSYPGSWDSVTFSDQGHAIMNNNYTSIHCQVNRKGQTYILTRSDTTQSTSYMDEMSHNINFYIGQVKPVLFSESLSSSTRGEYYFQYSATEKFLLSLTGNELIAPLIEYKYYRHDLANGGYHYGQVNNNLQEDFFKNLTLGDTVVLSEYVLTYEE